jgi:hypothetical protein
MTTTEDSDEVAVSLCLPESEERFPAFSMSILQGTRKPDAERVVSPDLPMFINSVSISLLLQDFKCPVTAHLFQMDQNHLKPCIRLSTNRHKT